MIDKKTHDYFDEFTPHYSTATFNFALGYLNKFASIEETLIDIGCGDGEVLQLIKSNTPLKKIVGMDISPKYLRKVKELVGCDTIQGSILDKRIVAEYGGTFDYCTCKAVLHHLIGKDRKESFQNAKTSIRNSIELLKPGGSLLIYEPCHGPAALMDVVFWIKKIFGSLTTKRIEFTKQWTNIGQPVVSYYTPDQLISLFEDVPGTEIVTKERVDERWLGFVIHREGMGIIVRKVSGDN